MEIPDILLIAIGVFALILAVLNTLSLFYFYKTNQRINAILEKGKIKDLRDIFLNQIGKIKEQDKLISKIVDRVESLENISERTIQKVGVIRFNPFNNVGGNQSFVIALLDKKNNGFVISSFFIEEGNRVYAKVVRNGLSEHVLSDEEKKAIERATGSRKS